jgi:hypothetical protein
LRKLETFFFLKRPIRDIGYYFGVAETKPASILKKDKNCEIFLDKVSVSLSLLKEL